MLGKSLSLISPMKTLISLGHFSRRYAAKKTISERYRALFHLKFPDAPYDFVCQIGDPVLRQKCDEVHPSLIKTPGFQSLIRLMWSVHKNYQCYGLSAPQIGLPLQVAVIGCAKEQCQEKSSIIQPVSPKVLINPVMKILNYKSKIIAPEACASMCSFNASVSRYTDIRVEAFNEEGMKVSWDAHGFEARIIQHEVDHLEGTIYTDKMEPRTLECSVWQHVNAHKGKGFIKFRPSNSIFSRIKLL